MQELIAFQLTLTGSAQNLTAWPVKNGITVINNSASNTVTVGNSSTTATSGGAVLNDTGTQSNSVYIPLPGGNTNQIWVNGTTGQAVSIIGT